MGLPLKSRGLANVSPACLCLVLSSVHRVVEMHLLSLFTSALLAGSALARSSKHVGRDIPELNNRRASGPTPHLEKRGGKPNYGGPAKNGYIIEQTPETKKFAVDGSALPFVDFDVGESYAGLLPISNESDVSELYFW